MKVFKPVLSKFGKEVEMKLIILGAPGSGKGTISELIVKHYKLKHISGGELIRQEIEKKSFLGKIFSKKADKGQLVDDNYLETLLEKNLPKDNFILDGTPRNVHQKHMLDKIFTPDHVIFIDTSKKEIISRLAQRYECPKCKTIYGKNFKPKKSGYCDKDSTKLERRKDDDPKIITTRFKVYNKETKPVLRMYGKKVVRINGDRKPEAIFKDIRKVLK